MTIAATPTVELATLADLGAIHTLRLAQGWSATDEVVRAVMQWERGRVFVIRASALAGNGEPAQPVEHTGMVAALDARTAANGAANGAANDTPVVVTGAIAAGSVGMIGSVIVRDDYQRRGLGRYIMGYALDWLWALGVRAVYLDATPAGRPLYTSLGFASQGAHSWFTLTPLAKIDHAALAQRAEGLRATSVETNDAGAVTSALTRLAALDGAAFGGDRMGLVASLIQRPTHHLYVVDDASGAPAGYLVAYPTGERYHGVRVGPWVAASQAAAAATLLAMLQAADEWLPQRAPQPDEADDDRHMAPLETSPDGRRDARYDGPQMVLSLPGTNPQALDLLRAIGCTLVLDDLMMRLDLPAPDASRAEAVVAAEAGQTAENATGAGSPSQTAPRLDGDPALVYAWMASMVF